MLRRDFFLMPVSHRYRNDYLEDLINQGASLAIHSNTSLLQAHQMPMCDIVDFFRCTAFDGFRKSEESRLKMAVAMFGRLDAVIKQIHGLGKVLAGRR
jgi:hypothetical protein